MTTIVITGAAGQIGGMLRSRLTGQGRMLRLLDVTPVAAGAAEEAVTASVTDMDAMTAACTGADAVVHLGGIPSEAAWEQVLEVNINGTYTVLEAARRAGVRRVVFASSNHAVGFTPLDAVPIPDYAFPAPDTFYGASKAAGEALGALYSRRHGMDVICVRILSCFDRPRNTRMLSTWLSPDDAGRLFEACLTAPSPGFRVVFGVSANTRGGLVSLDEARALGYEPRDDSEQFAAEIIAEHGEPAPDDPEVRFLGGNFTGPNPPMARVVPAQPSQEGDPSSGAPDTAAKSTELPARRDPERYVGRRSRPDRWGEMSYFEVIDQIFSGLITLKCLFR